MADVAKLPANADKPVERPQKDNYEDENSHITNDNSKTEQSVNHHDSEYDTASDLEGGDDDYDDDDEESLGANEDDDLESENGSIVFDLERQRGDGQEQADFAKKVDEDRSNPQYIPKKGTFYEHDDRTADEPVSNENKTEEVGDGETTKSSTPTISASSKTMKKWQPASAVDRWSHDRYDETEQAPKSRAELVSAYGYDIRNEDGPPRARRRRHYGRGPNKYVRNWEDESAYIKSSGGTPQRKPRPEDFPALGDRDKKVRKSRSFREEKENRYDRHNDRTGGHRSNAARKEGGRVERKGSGKDFRSSRQNVEYKNQNKNRVSNNETQIRNSSEKQVERENIRQDDNKVQVETVSFTNTKLDPSSQTERYNGHDTAQNQNNQISAHREIKEKAGPINSNITSNRQSPQTSHISSRLQVQNRNDPSHVGSVQMHSLVGQTQDLQQSTSEAGRTKRYSSLRQRSQNDVGVSQPTQMNEHNLQQIQMHEHHQQQQQQQPAPQPPHPQQQPAPQPPHPQQPTQQQSQQHVLLQDQHLLQANLMQIYHNPENIQAQMQGVSIQSLPTAHQPKSQYSSVQAQYPATGNNVSGYYPSTNEFATPAPAAPATSFTQAPSAAYIQPQPPASQIAFNTQSQPTGANAGQPLPATMNYVQTPPAPTAAAPYQNFSSYQNYNTVGGTTYFVPPQQPPPRPVVLPQRRPTNAIPILAPPSDKSKSKGDDDGKGSSSANAPIGSAENIDHILDNMFVQRPPYQPPTRKSSSPATESVGTSTSASVDENSQQTNNNNNNNSNTTTSATNSSVENRLEDAVQNLSLAEESDKIHTAAEQPQQKQELEPPSAAAAAAATVSTTGVTVASSPSSSEITQSETG